MSQIFIQHYLNELATLKKVSGSRRESVMREAFKDLLKAIGRSHDLHFVPEYEIETKAKERRYVDGALLYELRMPFGYWEAKDEKDDLDAEIALKFKRGYPQDNIIFEDTREAVLFQNRSEAFRCNVDDVPRLEKLLNLFFGYERKEIGEFRLAVEQFKTDLPDVLKALRQMIDKAHVENAAFRKASSRFLVHAQETINPAVTQEDVHEMLIQHVLTEDIFAKVFDEDEFHRQNNIAKELYALEGTFFTGDLKKRTLRGLDAYYMAIRSAATQISSHSEKQTFLKVVYENFYKVYNKKAADRLGVVYTPNEIVRFMIASTDWLCEKHFSRHLIDKDVDILDPATGTGTFISEMLEYFRGQPSKLKQKYLYELHANEIGILPYYVANLNIEATYAALTGEYLEFPSLCFVDTLDNVAGLRKHAGHVDDIFGSLSEENVGRIRRQNGRRISVVIGNPPYNASQISENDDNKNRDYPVIDARLKETYIAHSAAQKTKLYDPYARFFRWASDRLDQNGILAFVSNRSFIDRRTYDGFRKTVSDEFSEIYVIDLGGDVRLNTKLSGTTHNVFGIQIGVAISFMVKKAKREAGTRIHYIRRPEFETAEEKLAFLASAKIQDLNFESVAPDSRYNWIDLASNDFGSLLPIASKATKMAKSQRAERALFKLYSLGISTNRDEWVYADEERALAEKMRFFIGVFDKNKAGRYDPTIKWSRNLKRRFDKGRRESFSADRIVTTDYRPFTKRFLYDSELFIDETGAKSEMFPAGQENISICFSDVGSRASYCVLAVNGIADLHFGASSDAYQQVPLYRIVDGQRLENITDWGFARFLKHYKDLTKRASRPMTKEAIFYYAYAVLHDPIYRERYAVNLKRDFPHIPFYPDFWQWAEWGQTLANLHVHYEQAIPASLERIDKSDEKDQSEGAARSILSADKSAGRIVLDSKTVLAGVPSSAWEYRLGNRSALEWVLDQHKEGKPKGEILREKFDTYRFMDYKEKVVDLLGRITTVSVETMKIVGVMRSMPRTDTEIPNG